ncbi:Flp pilus assembly protein CpaB [Sphingobium chlorophenolicum]|uniref:Flp pilus assembly protein CpaB n=1 Tax=Sphingobium chlorophenolicum TaxID=46429 RepID=A0A081RG36_SPHCR|nr:Flp pilus assembly protein CpaB [Sphingobium chlorophenolicum]KEQ54159.1 Flp pilus assembly protein CpaB precursor [Sphingobium chlorophenolicum]
MGQRRSLIVLGLAILLGLAAVFIANSYLSRAEKAPAAEGGMAKVVVATVSLPFGSAVTAEKIRVVDWPANSVPPGAFRDPIQLTSLGKGRVVLRQIEPGEPILASKLSGEGGRATMSAVLAPEMRAVAVRVSDVAAAGGFVLPGDTVDVFVTRTFQDPMGGASQQITDVLLQGTRVIAIDQNANDTSKDPAVGKTATLEVNQVDAQKLVLAQQVGQLTLVLRNLTDKPNPAVQTVGIEDLRDGAYVGGYAGPRARVADMAYLPPRPTSAFRPARRAVPKNMNALPSTASVEIVRGTTGTSYEVKRYGSR